jgi:hypothetical protein
VDEPLALVDLESIDPDRLVVDLNFEFCISWNQASGSRQWVQAECLLDDSGGVWESACEDTVGFTGLVGHVCCRGGAGAEDEVAFFTQALRNFGFLYIL